MLTNDIRPPFKEKLGYGMGGFGLEFVYSTVNIFIMYFFTDVVMISAATAGLILMATRFWDAITDPLMGYISDHSKSKRPFILFGGIALGAAFYFLLQTPDLTAGGKFWYYFLVMIVMWTFYTVASIPYHAILPNITLDSFERASFAGYSRFFVLIALVILGGATKPLSKAFGPESVGYSRLGLLYGAIIIVFLALCFFMVKERVSVENANRYKIREILGLIWKNKPFLILLAVLTCVFVVFTITGMMMNYFFKYNIDFEGFIPIAYMCLFAVGALAMPFWIWLSKKVGKKNVYSLSFFIYGLVFLALFFVHSNSLPLLLTMFVIAGIAFSGVGLSCFSLVPDTVEYAEWKYGVRSEGAQYGVYSFVMKLAGSIAALFAGLVMDFSGYAANVAQTETSLLGIRLLMSLIPAAFCFIGIAILQWYKIDASMHRQMVQEIGAR